MHLPILATFILSVLATAIPADTNGINSSPWTEIVDLSTASAPTVEQAAVQARKLLLSETITTLSTIYPYGERHGLEGQPVGLMDYYADCSEDGNPTLLGMKIATSFRNAAAYNSSISFSIRMHSPHMFSPAAHPRVALIGTLSTVPPDSPEAERVKKCFTLRHPDARLWAPGNKFHGTYWVRFEVKSVYWIGGFGGIAYIGWIPTEVYRKVKLPFEEVQRTIEGESGGGEKEEKMGWRRFFYQDL
ncbi:pyridoxamine 5'-phosphate oxidase-domain-containing protein [Trichophaea hybrida]|nr:pyridoxamine 5'-phosphate oxidase-domain-containing protein [Trichophaea hybrida]